MDDIFVIFSYFSGSKSPSVSIETFEDNNLSDYESGSPPSPDEFLTMFPSLQHKINTKFSNMKWDSSQKNTSGNKFNFGDVYNQLYSEFDKSRQLRQRTGGDNETAKWVDYHQDSYQCDIASSSVQAGVMKKTKSCEKLGDKTSAEHARTSISSDFGGSAGAVNNMDSVEDSQIWCIDYLDNLIVIGCKNGRLEVWEGTTGKFKVIDHFMC